MTTIPAWLRAHLEQIGAWNADGVNRRTAARHCRACGQPVLTGLDHHASALPVSCDPTPLNPLGELQALLTGHSTFRLAWLVDHYEIDARTQFDIRSQPAGSDKQSEVIRSHMCGSNIPAAQVGEEMAIPTPTKGATNECPF